MESTNKKPDSDIMYYETERLIAKDHRIGSQKSSKAPFKVCIYKNSKAFAYLYLDWTELAEKSDQLVCMSPDWVSSWWKHFGRNKNRSLFIIAVYDQEKPVAIFPFFKGITRIFGKVVEKRLQLIGSGGNRNEQWGFSDDYGISDFLDFVVDPDYQEAIADLFISLLKNSELSGHRIIFNHVRDDSYIHKFIYRTLLESKIPVKKDKTDHCPYIDLTDSDHLLSFVEQCKSNARRRFRQIFRAEGPNNEYQFEEAGTKADVEKMSNHLIRLHQKRWNEIGFPGAFHDPRFREFFKEIVLNAHQKNQLWLKQAVDSQGVCAVRMLLLYNGRYYDYMSGYDDDRPSAKYRPGIALLLNLIHDAIENKVEIVELLRGDEGYKYDFTKNEITNWAITVPNQQVEKIWGMIPVSTIYFFSNLFKQGERELILLKVQQRKSGFFGMIMGYLQFRLRSLKN